MQVSSPFLVEQRALSFSPFTHPVSNSSYCFCYCFSSLSCFAVFQLSLNKQTNINNNKKWGHLIITPCMFFFSVKTHAGNCPKEILWCENKCGAKLERRFLTNHMKNECHKRTVTCQYCDREFVYETLQVSTHFSYVYVGVWYSFVAGKVCFTNVQKQDCWQTEIWSLHTVKELFHEIRLAF